MVAKEKPIKEKLVYDWEAIENDYRAGILSLREIGVKHNISHVSVTKRAKKDGWVRDLAQRIEAQAIYLVNSDAVNTLVNSKTGVLTERAVIEANATMQADIIRAHRKDITRGRALSMALLAELEATTADQELFKQLGDCLAEPDEKGRDKRHEIFKRVLEMPQRVDSFKKMTEALRMLIGLEREAFVIKGGGEEEAGGVVVVGTKTDYAAIRALIAARKNAAQP